MPEDTADKIETETLYRRDGPGSLYLLETKTAKASMQFRIWRAHDEGGAILRNDEGHQESPHYVLADEDAMPYLEGFLRFDGCLNLGIPSLKSSMLHFCGQAETDDLSWLLEQLYIRGRERIPGWL